MLFAVMATIACKASGNACVDKQQCPEEPMRDVESLLQTYTTKSTTMQPAEALHGEAQGGPEDIVTRIWLWITQGAYSESNAKDPTEATKRFHKDFIAAALIMSCVLPWTCPTRSTAAGTTASGLLRMLPCGQALRVLCVLLLWLKHYCVKDQHGYLEISFVIAGAILDIVNRHNVSEDDMWKKLSEFVPDNFARLYPFYTFYVLVCYLVFFSSPSTTTEILFGGSILLSRAGSIVAWFLSVVFGCYLVLPVLASPPQNMQSGAVAMICAGCVAMVVLPRTLAAPVHSPWNWTGDASLVVPPGTTAELFVARRSLLLGLAYFFFGLILSRIGPYDKLSGVSNVRGACKQPARLQGRHHAGQREVDLWKAFEDEAKRDMMRSLSVNKSADHANHGYVMSPRSDRSSD